MIDEIFSQEHGNVGKEYIPIDFFNNEFELIINGKSYQKEVDLVKEKVPEFFEDIYYIPNQIINSFVFLRKFICIPLYTLDLNYWENINMIGHIKQTIARMEKHLEENDYTSIFSFMEKSELITSYIDYFDEIPEEQRYDCFRDLWVRSEYGFELFDEEILERIFSYKEYSINRTSELEQFKEKYADKNIITIYRGVATKSLPFNESISWTLNEKIARWFANRFNNNGKVYKAEVNINDIVDYLARRGENEVFVFPDKLMNVKEI